MAMNIGTDYSSYKAGHTSVDIPQYEKGDFEKHRKESEAIKPELDEWKANNEKIRGGKANYERGVVYDKSGEPTDNSTYSINKMSASDRAAIVDQLKADAREREQQLVSIVHRTIADQAGAYGTEPVPLAVEAQSLNHWTTREVPFTNKPSWYSKQNKLLFGNTCVLAQA